MAGSGAEFFALAKSCIASPSMLRMGGSVALSSGVSPWGLRWGTAGVRQPAGVGQVRVSAAAA